MTEKEAKERVREMAVNCTDYERCRYGHECTIGCPTAALMAMNALDAQIRLKEYIERINQPEYNGVVWQKDEVVMLLRDLLAERIKR